MVLKKINKDELLTLYNQFSIKMNLKVNRPFIKKIKGCDLIGVEIGVFCGENAYNILSHLSIKTLYLIDPYKEYIDFIYHSENKQNNAEIKAKKKLNKFNDKIKWLKMPSGEAYTKIPNNLDFIYIDGNHNYEYVLKDMQLYYPKLKKGGIMGGHDYQCPDVARAIVHFTDMNNLKFICLNEDWMIQNMV